MKLPNFLANKHLQDLFIPAFAIIAIAIAYASAYPYSPENIEFNTLYLGTADYWNDKLSDPSGLSNLLACFIQQFYRWTSASVALLLLFLVLTTWFCTQALDRIGLRNNCVALIPALVASTMYPVGAETAVQCLFFWLLLYIYTLLPRFRPVYACLVGIAGYALLPWTILLCWMLATAFIEGILFKKLKGCVGQLVAILILAVLPSVWNEVVGFIPFGKRYLGSAPVQPAILAYVLPLLLAWSAGRLKQATKYAASLLIALAATVGSIFYTLNKPEYRANEILAKLTSLANKEEWHEILNEIQYEDCNQPIYLRYALLAENALGTLPQHLFYYPVTSSKDFLFQHDGNLVGLDFNRHFYQNINVPDECFHLSFEYATRSTDCFSLGALRNMTTYAIQTGDTAVASKYIRVLKTSTLHSDWAAEKQEELGRAIVNEHKTRSNTFVGALPFIGEMVLLVDEDRNNTRRMEYLLCALLLERQLTSFGNILKASKLYRDELLPQPYAEAVAMLAMSVDPSLRTLFQYDPNLEKSFSTFMQQKESGQISPETMEQSHSYWYYFFFAPQPPSTNNMQ